VRFGSIKTIVPRLKQHAILASFCTPLAPLQKVKLHDTVFARAKCYDPTTEDSLSYIPSSSRREKDTLWRCCTLRVKCAVKTSGS
jgi:hypothetical protein